MFFESCQSSGGGVASAEALASIYGLLATEGRVEARTLWTRQAQLDAETARNDPRLEEPAARTEARFAWDLGLMVSPSADVFGSAPVSGRAAGHPGASGAVGYADPVSQVSIGLTINGVGGSQMYKRYRELGDLVRLAVAPSY
ncbi:MAG: serine hydrolase [Gammaproteobacteria bacterium]